MSKVTVICGGTSDERAVSLRSGAAVAAALEKVGHEVAVLDTTDSDDQLVACDVVFPVLHGVGGEDGEIQARLEARGARFVGSGSVASRLCMNKGEYRQKMMAAGFQMAQGAVVDVASYTASPFAQVPHVLKPIDGGSSIDTRIIRAVSPAEIESAVECFTRHETMLLEELIVGTEVTVGVLNETALPVIEIIPPDDGEFDYENKYNGKTQELCPPKHVSSALQESVQALAVRVHVAAGCRDVSRSDFIITPQGTIYLLETNTIPGMTDQSLYPKMAATAGIAFPQLCDQLVQLALSR